MHFLLDHDWMHEMGETLPIYRVPLDMHRLFGEPEHRRAPTDGASVTVRYLTPHSKWSIHSEYQDNLFMLSLSRGGPVVWMSPADAAAIGVRDNDWVEAVEPQRRDGAARDRRATACRAGTVFVYHAQERVVNVPKSRGAPAAAAASTTR